MSFYNSFKNITSKNNTFKVLAVYNVNGVPTGTSKTLKITEGNYKPDKLAEAMNTLMQNLNTGVNLGSYKTGLQIKADAVSTGRFTLNAPEGVLSNPPVPAYNLAHQYVGFYLLVDTETIPLLTMLGFTETVMSNIINDPIVFVDGTGTNVYRGIGVTVVTDFANELYRYSEANTNGFVGSDVYNLSSVKALNIGVDGISSQIRAGKNLNSNNLLDIVTVDTEFLFLTHYEGNPNPYKVIQSNNSMNSITLIITDAETGERVDFDGADWILTMRIESKEIDNTPKSATAYSGLDKAPIGAYHNAVDPLQGYNKRSRN